MPQPQSRPSSSVAIRFAPGDIVVHGRDRRRGVVIEVDEWFRGPDEQYRDLTAARGPKRSPWYHVLFEGTAELVYVAQCHLESDLSGQPIRHPMITSVFTEFRDGRYIRLNH